MTRPALRIKVAEKDQKDLRNLLRGGIQQVRVTLRALTLLRLAKGMTAPQTTTLLELTPQSVRKIAHRDNAGGLPLALYDRQRPGAAELLDDLEKQLIVATVCIPPPEGQARWTIRCVTEQAVKKKLVPRVDRKTIRILLQSHDLKPWREKLWCVPELNEEYVSRMEDLLELYERPHNPRQPVLCLDEKPVALHTDFRPVSPAKPGREAPGDSEYSRCGTANIFCAVEPKAGRHFTYPTANGSAAEFSNVILDLAIHYPAAQTIHLVLDNLNIHRRKSLTDLLRSWVGAKVWGRFTVHYTPAHGSWLNQAEIEIGILSSQCLGKRRIPDLKTLRNQVEASCRRMNQVQTRINWLFTRRDARAKFG
ncbi:MAG: IS630 family transposase [Acidobacteriota bacterium]